MRKRIIASGVFVALQFAAIDVQASCSRGGSYVAASGHIVKVPRCQGFGHEGAHYRCVDGSYSHSEHLRGACSRHGGVASTL